MFFVPYFLTTPSRPYISVCLQLMSGPALLLPTSTLLHKQQHKAPVTHYMHILTLYCRLLSTLAASDQCWHSRKHLCQV